LASSFEKEVYSLRILHIFVLHAFSFGPFASAWMQIVPEATGIAEF